MVSAKPTRLIVFPRYSDGLWHIPPFRFLAEWAIKKQLRREGLKNQSSNNLCILVPDAARQCIAPSELSSLSWSEIKRFAECQNEELEDFIEFQRAAARVFEERRREDLEISTSQALLYGFLASHSEDLPFWISGLHKVLSERNIQAVVLPQSKEFFPRLVQQVAEAKGVNLVWSPPGLFRVLDFIETGYGFLREVRAMLSHLLDGRRLRAVGNSGSVLVVLGKERSWRFARPAGDALLAQNISYSVVSPNNLVFPWRELGGLPALARAGMRWIVLWRWWRQAEPLVRALPHKYKGVAIGEFHVAQMKPVWFSRGPVIRAIIEDGEKILRAATLRALLIVDPIEMSVIFGRMARKRGIPVVAYYSAYNGCSSTATLWEEGLDGAADVYATVNQWMANRLVEKRGIVTGKCHVVGDVIQALALDEANTSSMNRLRDSFHLPADQKIVVFLSRPVSGTLRLEEKEWILRELGAACSSAGAALLVKAHPNENPAALSDLMMACAPNAIGIIRSEFPLGAVIGAAHLVVGTPASSSNVDTAYLGVPLCLMGPRSVFDWLDEGIELLAFRKNRAAICVSPGDDVQGLLRQALEDVTIRSDLIRNAGRFVQSHFGANDGNAGKRLAGLVGQAAES